MDLTETSALLAICAAFDNRDANPDAVHAWQAALHDVSFDDAKDAVVEHYRRQSAWIMPAHVRDLVRAAGNARQARFDHQLAIGGEPRNLAPNLEWLERKRAKRRAIATSPAPQSMYSIAMAAMNEMLAKNDPPADSPDVSS